MKLYLVWEEPYAEWADEPPVLISIHQGYNTALGVCLAREAENDRQYHANVRIYYLMTVVMDQPLAESTEDDTAYLRAKERGHERAAVRSQRMISLQERKLYVIDRFVWLRNRQGSATDADYDQYRDQMQAQIAAAWESFFPEIES